MQRLLLLMFVFTRSFFVVVVFISAEKSVALECSINTKEFTVFALRN